MGFEIYVIQSDGARRLSQLGIVSSLSLVWFLHVSCEPGLLLFLFDQHSRSMFSAGDFKPIVNLAENQSKY